MTNAENELIQERRFNVVEWGMNCYDCLRFIKNEYDLRKMVMNLEEIISDNHISVKDKTSIIAFVYPEFERSVDNVKKIYNKRNETFKFELKPIINFIWGC